MDSYQVPVDVKPEPDGSNAPDVNIETVESGDPALGGKTVLRATVVPKPVIPRDPSLPAWLPEKFLKVADLSTATVELAKKLGRGGAEVKILASMPPGPDLAEFYSEMEAAQSKGEKEDGAQPPDAKKVEEPPADTSQAEVTDILAKAGLKYDEFQSEFSQAGGLSEESYKKLSDAGFPKSLVDRHLAGQKALAEAQHAEIYAVMGGSRESFEAVATWSAKAMTADERKAFNEAMDAGGTRAKVAAKGLWAQYEADGQAAPKLVHGARPSAASAEPKFTSTAQVQAAMNDPRYAVDEAYRQSVARRM